MTQKVSYVLDVDIRTFFDSVDHGWLLRMIAHRIADRRVLRLIERWLKAGILESGRWEPVEVGTPQGSGITPPTIWQNCRSSPALSLRARPFGHDTVTDSPARR